MNTTTIFSVLVGSLLVVGCEKQAPPPTSNHSTAAPITQSSLAAWQQGDKAQAISNFVAIDWSRRPLFSTNSGLNLSEAQFQALSAVDRQLKSGAMMAQLDEVKRLAVAVTQAGQEAASKGDVGQARKYFQSLKQCGAALESPDSLRIVQLTGQALQKMAKTELDRIGP